LPPAAVGPSKSGPYRGHIRGMQARRKAARSVPGFVLIRGAVSFQRIDAVTFVLIPSGHGVSAAEPFSEVDIGAAFRAERAIGIDRRLTADRASHGLLVWARGRRHSGKTSGAIDFGVAQPIILDRKLLGVEEAHDLGQRQADDVGVGTDEPLDEASRQPLDGVATGLPPPLA